MEAADIKADWAQDYTDLPPAGEGADPVWAERMSSVVLTDVTPVSADIEADCAQDYTALRPAGEDAGPVWTRRKKRHVELFSHYFRRGPGCSTCSPCPRATAPATSTSPDYSRCFPLVYLWLLYTSEVAAGGRHTVILRSDGSALARGFRNFGQLTYTQVAAGILRAVLLRGDGPAVACGEDQHGWYNIP